MITITHHPESPGGQRYKAIISLKNTIVEDYAPYGAGINEPHVYAFGYTPEGSLKAAYESLGQYLCSRFKELPSSGL